MNIYALARRLASIVTQWASERRARRLARRLARRRAKRRVKLFNSTADVLSRCSYDVDAIKRGELMMGVELEMECKNDYSVREIIDAVEVIGEKHILKHDGSLKDGAELVTIPLTLNGHRNDFEWKTLLSKLRPFAYSGKARTCGMHVHINKRALTPLLTGKMLVFLNDLKMQNIISQIAQRNPNNACRRVDKKFTDGKKLSQSRHETLNLKARTVEVRIFQGNLRPERVLKNLEFCHAMVSYCREQSLREITNPQAFERWLHTHKKDYPELVKFLVEKGITNTSAVSARDFEEVKNDNKTRIYFD